MTDVECMKEGYGEGVSYTERNEICSVADNNVHKYEVGVFQKNQIEKARKGIVLETNDISNTMEYNEKCLDLRYPNISSVFKAESETIGDIGNDSKKEQITNGSEKKDLPIYTVMAPPCSSQDRDIGTDLVLYPNLTSDGYVGYLADSTTVATSCTPLHPLGNMQTHIHIHRGGEGVHFQKIYTEYLLKISIFKT